MILSIRDKAEGADIALGCFDLGLTEAQKSWLTARRVELVTPEWSFGLSDADGVPLPFKAILSRPLLPRYFPGHDVYMHMDADAWVQDWAAVELYKTGPRAASWRSRRRSIAPSSRITAPATPTGPSS